jgi:predicted flap endonuclease-1-like 5' DNA nuclease
MAKLVDVEGIGPVNAEKLKKAGVGSTDSLLSMGGTAAGRKDLAANAGVSDKLLLEWVNHVDLFRIKGVGEEYADLLEEAGVDTVVELAQRRADNLLAKMNEVNASKNLVNKMPALSQVEDWVAQAKKLPRAVSY